jgi:CBS domain-containing protein
MQIKDVMTRDVQVIEADASIYEAAQIMKREDIGMLPVLDGQKLVGTLTDRDIVLRTVAEGRDPLHTAVSEILTRSEVVYCFEDQEIEEAADLMGEKQIRRLVILNHEQRLAGIVSLGDLAVDSPDKRPAAEALKRVSSPGR